MGKRLTTFLITLLIVLSQLEQSFIIVKATDYTLNNGLIRFDYSSSSAINASTGFLNQPFYHSSNGNWYQLTFSNYPLDFTVGEGGDGSTEWNTNGTKLENPSLTNLTVDSSGMTYSNGLSYGTLITSGTFSINSKSIEIKNTYLLNPDKSFVKITTKLTNLSAQSLSNFRYWVGTRDDYVGRVDSPTKTRGTIVNGSFTQLSSASQKASALQIVSGPEGVLFYTDMSGANMSVNGCCSFSNATNQDPLTCTTQVTNDGSYAMYMRLNDLAPNSSQEVTWFYAAGAASDLQSIVSDVASAASSFTDINYRSAKFTVSSSVNSTGYFVLVPNGSTAPTSAQIIAGANYGSVTLALSGSHTLTANTPYEFNLSGLSAGGTYQVYFVSQYTDSNNQVQTTNISSATLNLVAYGPPILDTTGAASSITKTGASVSGNVTNDNSEGTLTVNTRGFCYSTTANPSLTNGATCAAVDGTGTGSFSTSLTGLQNYTTYYVRAYATNNLGTGYGAQSSFRTLERTLSPTLTGLSAPVTGVTRPSSFSGTGYTATVVWSPSESDNKFHADKEYTATITLTPTTGYDLNGVVANTFSLSGATSLTHSDNSGVITAVFPTTQYNQVSYNTNGGSLISSVNVDYGAAIPQPTSPTKTGYSFAGWYSNVGLTSAVNFSTMTMPGSNTTLFAKWTINNHDLSFSSSQGTAPSTLHLDYGSSITEPTAPTEDGYTFRGWYTNSNFTTPFDFTSATMPDSNVTLYGKWTANYSDVTYHFNNGVANETETYAYNSPLTQPTYEPKIGHTFGGWYLDSAYTQAFNFVTEIMPANDIDLYLKWNVNQYRLTYVSSLGTAPSSVLIDYQSSLLLPNALEVPGYEFLGWYRDSSFSTPIDFSLDRMGATDQSVYAKWRANTYTIQYDYSGGTGNNPSSFTVLDSVNLGIAAKEGYTFLGWLKDGSYISSLPRGTIGDISLQAQWQFAPKTPVLGSVSLISVDSEGANLKGTISDWGNPKLNQFGYELTDASANTTTTGSLGSDLSIQLSGLKAYTNYSLRVVASNGTQTIYSNSVTFMPKLKDSDNDGIPDVRDAYPTDGTKSIDVTLINPDKEPSRAFIGEKPTTDALEYQLKLSEADLMGLDKSDNILVVMGTVQFVIPVSMVDSIIANTGDPDAYLTLRVEPQLSNTSIQPDLLNSEGMDLVEAYDYRLFQIFSDGTEEAIHELGGKIKVGIGLDTLQGEYDPSTMEVYYYNTDDGTIQSMKAVYDPVNRSLVFMTEHFSYYVIGVKKKDDPAIAALKLIGFGIALGLALFGFIVWILKRRKKVVQS